MAKSNVELQREQRVGERRTNSQGLTVEITAYRSSCDIDLLFSNGDERKGTTYRNFKEGSCLSEKETLRLLKEKYEGQVRVNFQGYKMVCTEYKTKNDIEVTFETGEVYSNIKLNSFDKGYVDREHGAVAEDKWKDFCASKAKQKSRNLVGQVFTSREGLSVEVIIAEGKLRLYVFCKESGLYRWTKYTVLKSGLFSATKLIIGTEFMSVDGYKMRVIGNGDLLKLLCVDTGEEIDRVQRSTIKNKEFKYREPKTVRKNINYEGREIKFSNGVKGITRNYDGKGSCDVELVGTSEKILLEGLNLDRVSSGRFPRKYEEYLIYMVESGVLNSEGIVLPKRKVKEGEIHRCRSGQKYKVVEVVSYKGHKGIIVEFEDGTRTGTRSNTIRGGRVTNPNFRVYTNAHDNTLSVSSGGSSIGCVVALKVAYILSDGVPYYLCRCNSCNKKDILTSKEMALHRCNKGILKVPEWVKGE